MIERNNKTSNKPFQQPRKCWISPTVAKCKLVHNTVIKLRQLYTKLKQKFSRDPCLTFNFTFRNEKTYKMKDSNENIITLLCNKLTHFECISS